MVFARKIDGITYLLYKFQVLISVDNKRKKKIDKMNINNI